MNPDARRSRKGLCKFLGYMPQAFLQIFAVASAQAGIDPEGRKTKQKHAAGQESICPIKNVHGLIVIRGPLFRYRSEFYKTIKESQGKNRTKAFALIQV